MSRFPRPCSRCGARVESGASLCDRCAELTVSVPRICKTCRQPIADGVYCPACDPAAEHNRAAYRELYNTAEYRKNRKARFERAKGLCEDCGMGPLLDGEWECDHAITIKDWVERGLRGSPNQIGNLRIRCTIGARCHQRKTTEDRRVRAARKAAGR